MIHKFSSGGTANHLDLPALGFQRAMAASPGRPAYHPGDLLKVYLYGYLNRVRSSRLLERETQRNVSSTLVLLSWAAQLNLTVRRL